MPDASVGWRLPKVAVSTYLLKLHGISLHTLPKGFIHLQHASFRDGSTMLDRSEIISQYLRRVAVGIGDEAI
jgi:hypothetical protein